MNESLDLSAVCSKPVRKLRLYEVKPKEIIEGKSLYIILKEDIPSPGVEETPAVLAKYSTIGTSTSSNSWVATFAVGEIYNLHWPDSIDFT